MLGHSQRVKISLLEPALLSHSPRSPKAAIQQQNELQVLQSIPDSVTHYSDYRCILTL